MNDTYLMTRSSERRRVPIESWSWCSSWRRSRSTVANCSSISRFNVGPTMDVALWIKMLLLGVYVLPPSDRRGRPLCRSKWDKWAEFVEPVPPVGSIISIRVPRSRRHDKLYHLFLIWHVNQLTHEFQTDTKTIKASTIRLTQLASRLLRTILFWIRDIKVFKRRRIRRRRWSHGKRMAPRHFVERKYITHGSTARKAHKKTRNLKEAYISFKRGPWWGV